jgi:hypothetical protein
VYHHGESVKEQLLGTFWTVAKDAQGNRILKEGASTIRVIDEKTNEDVTSKIMGDIELLGAPYKADLGAWGGPNSGDEFCVMRYRTAASFASRSDPAVRYRIAPEELDLVASLSLCGGQAGKVMNADTHKPNSHFGPAASKNRPRIAPLPPLLGDPVLGDRGNCLHQILVNDSVTSVPRR